jgi:hypothetical protein
MLCGLLVFLIVRVVFAGDAQAVVGDAVNV